MQPGQFADGDERLDRAVAGTGAVAGEGGVDAATPFSTATTELATERERFSWAWMPISVPGRARRGRPDPGGDVVHGQPAAGVGDVDAVRAVGLHQLGLLGELLGRRHVGQHQESGDVHAELAGGGDVLGGDVGLGAVGGDADRADAEVAGVLQLVDGADAGQQQRGEPRVLE